jgi:cell surface protein SprA
MGFTNNEAHINQAIWINALYNANLKADKLAKLADTKSCVELVTPRNSARNNKLVETFPGSVSSADFENINSPSPVNTKGSLSSHSSFTGFNIFESLGDTGKTQIDNKLIKDTSKVKNPLLRDTSKVKKDTVKVDLLKLDSTARMKYFHYERDDQPYITIKPPKTRSFFAEPSENLKKRIAEIDSTGEYVVIKEIVANQQTKIILKVPIEQYIKERVAQREREGWELTARDYKLKDAKKGLGELIKDFTDFEIPLPSVGVLSIFGEPKISLKIGGAVDIKGGWRNEKTEGVTSSALGNSRNEPDFKQTVQINVNGTIGDKLNINADWNTERTFEYENMLKIKYTGYDDEIIQSIEAGNVSLQTSPLVGGSEALFGVKAVVKMGPLTLTGLASQKKGEIKEVSVSSGSTSTTFSKRAYEYSTNHFFVDTLYASQNADLNLFYRYYGSATPDKDPTKEIYNLEVWKSTTQITKNPNERNANAYIDLKGIGKDQQYSDEYRKTITGGDGKSETSRFVLLQEGSDYIVHAETGWITFLTTVNDADIIACAYSNHLGPGQDVYYGELLKNAKDSLLVLKLIKPKGLQPAYTTAWKLQLKNIYRIGATGIKKEGFEFDVKREVEGQEPVSNVGNINFLNAFGLDLYDESGTQAKPDNKFDWREGLTIMPSSGEIIFPVLEPFGANLPTGLDTTYNFPQIYSQDPIYAQQQKTKDKWTFVGKSSGGVQSVYNLGFTVVENSVRVRLNGRELTPGVDYIMDYSVGQLTIRNDAALVPGANLSITYEQNDLFQLASKTLLGLRGEVEISEKTKLGFSVLNLNQQTLNDKVRIGEEPMSNTIYGLDFTTSADLPVVTKLLDKVFSTKEMSTFNFTGEYAYMNPDPNTKKSTIASDNGKSIAYIDDFEGSKKTTPVGVSYTSWKDISIPNKLPFLSEDMEDTTKMNYKAKSFWFNVTPSDVRVVDIWGDRKKVSKDDQNVTVLDYVFLPDSVGTYNHNPNLSDKTKNWGGIMKPLSSTANNLIKENIQYIEFWAKAEYFDPNAKFYIDMGRISEDVIPNRHLDTEDKNGNAIIDEGEDLGLDGMDDNAERANFNSTKGDPSGDDFSFSTGSFHTLMDYYNINGTEGNAVLTDNGKIPDTEDLNRNGNLDLVNNYFRYEIPLDTNAATNKYIVGSGGEKGWFLYRIPIRDTSAQVGSPHFENVETMRLWVSGLNNSFHLRLAEFNLVGNQWEKLNGLDEAVQKDSTLSISVVNTEDNPGYKSPPGVFPERDRSKPDEQVFRNEQALNLIIKELQPSESREAVKYLYQPLDVFNYTEMKLFVHGDENTTGKSISVPDTGRYYNSEAYFRFGSDTNNFYEYRQPVKSGWNEISINFKNLTALKQVRGDSTNIMYKIPVPNIPGHYYGVKGNPSLNAVKFLSVGIYNATKEHQLTTFPVSGEVWVNELRVVGADAHPGYAYTLSSAIKLADIMNLSVNMSYTDPYFHRLSDRFGSKVEQRNWGVSADVDIIKLLPFSLPESNLRVNYSHTESISKPLYVPGTDIEVTKAVEQLQNKPDSVKSSKTPQQIVEESQTISTSDSYSASNVKIKIPTNYWLIRDSFNALTFGFNYNKTFSRSPSMAYSKYWIWNANIGYGINLSPDYYFYIAKIPLVGTFINLFSDYRGTKIFFTPQSLNANMTAKRTRTISLNRDITGQQSFQENISKDFSATRGFSYAWKLTENAFFNVTTTYNVDISSSLAYLENDPYGAQRKESEIWKDIFSGAFFGKDYQYTQSFDIKTQPKLPALWNIRDYFNISFGYNVGYQWNNDLKQATLGRSASYNSRFNFTLGLRLKSLAAPLFAEDNKEQNKVETQQRNNGPQLNRRTGERINWGQNIDTTTFRAQLVDTVKKVEVVQISKRTPILKSAAMFLKTFTRLVFFDYETINFNFNNDNNLGKSGLNSEKSGFKNFWGFTDKDVNGPTRGFMFGFTDDVGLRAKNGNLQDVFSQKNSLDFRTSKPLWEGAKIELNWKVGWSMNKTTSISTDSSGNVKINNVTSTGTLNRSFLSFPPSLFLSVFKSGIKKAHELYNPDAKDKNAEMTTAFVQGFESMPILSKLGFLKNVINYIPRANWRITWDGLEKYFPFKSIAKRVSFEHAYNSDYTEGWKNNEGVQEIQSQRIAYGFAPLGGLNITFNDLWGGSLSGSIKYNVSSSFSRGYSQAQNITETFAKDIGITANYSKSGFEIPLFGLSLKNDIEFSLSYTNTKNSEILYNFDEFTEEGVPQNGSTRTTLEPRIRYTISSKVTISIYYRRSSVEPEGSSRITATTTNEAGLEVHITIQ